MSNGRTCTRWVVAALIVSGAVCLGLRLHNRYRARMIQGDSVWRLTYDVRFQAAKAGARLRAAVPSDARHGRVFRQELRYSGLSTERLQTSRTETRELSVVTQRGGAFHLTARFYIHLSPHASFRLPAAPAPRSAEERARYLRGTRTIQADSPIVVQTLQRLRSTADGKAPLLESLFEHCHAQIASGDEGMPSDAAGVLDQGIGTPLGRARALAALCRAAKLPARLVAGFEIRQQEEARPHVWVEVLSSGHWDAYDPENGYVGQMPHNYLAARRDGAQIVHAPDVSDLDAVFSIVPLPMPGGIPARGSQRPLDVLDLTRLPLEMHEVLSLLLLVPLGALVTSVFRTLIGLDTYGTFTPTLLALAFVYADWRSGLVVFAVVVGLGLLTRSLLDRLKLLVVPRLSIILTLVTALIVLAMSLLDYLHLTPSAQAVLLPMVILTMTIERFYLTGEEDGPRFALQRMAGTLLVGSCCYLVLCSKTVGDLLLIYPEVHLFTVAVLILMGRYAGYRLTELWRFRDL